MSRHRGADGLYIPELKRKILAAIGVVFLFSAITLAETTDADSQTGSSAAILNRYLQVTQTHDDSLRGASMEVDINASVPGLQEHGTLRALRKISKVGQITYHVLGFQGDSTVKSQVIARYLQAEQQGEGDQNLAITPVNYKFKYKGEQNQKGSDVYVFQVSPRKKRLGLFKGELWLDSKTCIPVYEKGRLVKNPSIFFKKVDFERAFVIQNGRQIPQSLSSTIDVHLIGKVELNINYSNFAQSADTDDTETTSDTTTSLPSTN